MPLSELHYGRRAFLRRLTQVTAAIALTLLTRCGLGGDDSSTRTFTSSTDSGHSHQLTVSAVLQSAPPASGTTLTTSEADGHTHTVDLTHDQLLQIASHQSFTVTTSNDVGHEHTFTFN